VIDVRYRARPLASGRITRITILFRASAARARHLVLLIARVIMSGTMVYYGWPKVKDPRTNAFDDTAKAGFTPGWFWGSIILLTLLTEFGGGIAVIPGFYIWVAASLIAY